MQTNNVIYQTKVCVLARLRHHFTMFTLTQIKESLNDTLVSVSVKRNWWNKARTTKDIEIMLVRSYEF